MQSIYKLALLAAWTLLPLSCGGDREVLAAASQSAPKEPPAAARGLAGTECDITHADADCQHLGSSATDCRTRSGARYGRCVDDLGNLCAGSHDLPGMHSCLYDQHCSGWESGLGKCTGYGDSGPLLCGVCRPS
jgi:hypothetical protein